MTRIATMTAKSAAAEATIYWIHGTMMLSSVRPSVAVFVFQNMRSITMP